MKSCLLSLGIGCLLASLPCRAQQPTPDGDAPPLLYIYVARYGANALPRIVLGVDKPALQITAFAKCVRISTANPKLAGLAAELTPEDAKALVAAVRKVSSPGNGESVGAILWLTTPDHKALDFISLISGNVGANLEEVGVMEFDAEEQSATVAYLTEKLHPK